MKKAYGVFNFSNKSACIKDLCFSFTYMSVNQGGCVLGICQCWTETSCALEPTHSIRSWLIKTQLFFLCVAKLRRQPLDVCTKDTRSHHATSRITSGVLPRTCNAKETFWVWFFRHMILLVIYLHLPLKWERFEVQLCFLLKIFLH